MAIALVYISWVLTVNARAAGCGCMLFREISQGSREGKALTVRMQFIRSILTAGGIVALALPFFAVPAAGQFPADSTLPKDKRSKRNIGKFAPGPTPRTKDGKPDLNGVWGYAGYTSDIAKDYDVGELPMTPSAEKFFK